MELTLQRGDKLIKILLLFSNLFILCSATQIHDHMTDEEILKTFQVTRDKVPEHEVVSVDYHSRNNDDTHRIKIRSVTKDIDLYLRPNEGLFISETTPVWLVQPHSLYSERLSYTKLKKNVLGNIGKLYHDYETNSAVVMTKKNDGKIQMTGRINGTIVLQPAPLRLTNELIHNHDRCNQSNLNNSVEIYPHIIYQHFDDNNNTSENTKRRNKNRKIKDEFTNSSPYPDFIYPELLAVLDYTLYETLGKNIDDSLLYLLSFWNAVDLRYRSLTDPNIRLHITCIIISTMNGGIPYLYKNILGDNLVDADLALKDMSHYFFYDGIYSGRFPFDTYDFAVALTKLDMCNMDGANTCDPGTLGYAYEWGACNRSYIDRNTEAVGIVEDNGGYSGLIPATHEVAHLLGVSHDNDENAEDETCSPTVGYIMNESYRFFGLNNFDWSECSVRQFQTFFKTNDSKCLFETAMTGQGDDLPRILPGTLQSLNDQCKKVCGGNVFKIDASICIELRCLNSYGAGCRPLAAAAEGSYCGDGKRCLSGYCLSVNETTIPSITNNAKQSYNKFKGYFHILRNHSVYQV